MRVLVTGGGGFIGSHVVERLVAFGYSVTVLDDFSTGCEENLRGINAEVICGSILDNRALAAAADDAGAVCHLAAIPSVGRSVAEPLLTHAANLTGTLAVLEACRVRGIAKIVYAASTSAQGDLGRRTRREAIQGMPLSPYGVAKYASELYGHAWHRIHSLDFTALRFFNVYGPRQRLRGAYSSVIPAFLSAGIHGTPAVIYGDGSQTRDFTWVGDVANACCLALEHHGIGGLTINVCSGRSVSILQLARRIERVLGVRLSLRFEPARPQEVRDVRGDNSLAARVLGFRAATRLDSGLHATAEWFRTAGEAPAAANA